MSYSIWYWISGLVFGISQCGNSAVFYSDPAESLWDCGEFIPTASYWDVGLSFRFGANEPLDENDPGSLVTLESYLKREQYGDWPIQYGLYVNSDSALYLDTFFPRMYDSTKTKEK